MKKHRQRTKPSEVLFPVYSIIILTSHKPLSRPLLSWLASVNRQNISKKTARNR